MYHIVLMQGDLEMIVATCKLRDDALFIVKALKQRQPILEYEIHHEREARLCRSIAH